MAALQITNTPAIPNPLKTIARETVVQLALLVETYPGRALFATRFSPEDQVLAHLVFGNTMPVRVFTFSGAAQNDLLLRSVDFFGGNIELSFRQARQAAAEFDARHPELVAEYEKNPAIAPLSHVLGGHHLLISGLRKDQLAASRPNPSRLEWDEAKQRAIYHPLFDWTNSQVQAYLRYYGIPFAGIETEHVPGPAGRVYSSHNTASQPAGLKFRYRSNTHL
jgi:phosphoadenosine phosphosulfate reductase